jgi:hypothetical protein
MGRMLELKDSEWVFGPNHYLAGEVEVFVSGKKIKNTISSIILVGEIIVD